MSTEQPTGTRFEDLPESDVSRVRERLRPRPSRRGFLGGVLGLGAAVGLGSLALVNRAADTAQAVYWRDWTNTATGPCATYARDHTENGIQCGPSPMCTSLDCCWPYESGAGNRVGWHKLGPARNGGYFLHRPGECWTGTYDSWHWKFSDGYTYRCSDGFRCSASGSCSRTICPWAM